MRGFEDQVAEIIAEVYIEYGYGLNNSPDRNIGLWGLDKIKELVVEKGLVNEPIF